MDKYYYYADSHKDGTILQAKDNGRYAYTMEPISLEELRAFKGCEHSQFFVTVTLFDDLHLLQSRWLDSGTARSWFRHISSINPGKTVRLWRVQADIPS